MVDAERGELLPVPEECGGVVVTGSHAMVTDRLPWSERLAEWIARLVEHQIPFLGICYGHQLLAHSLGGTVGYHPDGKEIGTVEIDLLPTIADDPLFGGLPRQFSVHVTHAQTVITLPAGTTRLATNSFEGNHAIRIGPCAWGVQFHPEYDERIMESYIREQEEELARAGRDLPEIYRTVRETPEAADLLRRFAELAGQFTG